MRLYLVCYDIADDRIRDRIAGLLEGYGERVQRSVFEVWLRSDRDKAELQGALAEAAGEERDIRFYPLCAECRRLAETVDGKAIGGAPAIIVV